MNASTTEATPSEYAELQEQAAEFDPIELHDARLTIRSEQERRATQREQKQHQTKRKPKRPEQER